MICEKCGKEIETNRIFDLCQDCYNAFLAEIENEWKNKFEGRECMRIKFITDNKNLPCKQWWIENFYNRGNHEPFLILENIDIEGYINMLIDKKIIYDYDRIFIKASLSNVMLRYLKKINKQTIKDWDEELFVIVNCEK